MKESKRMIRQRVLQNKHSEAKKEKKVNKGGRAQGPSEGGGSYGDGVAKRPPSSKKKED